MLLAVTGEVAHLYHIQRALSQGVVDRAWLSPSFHLEISNWRSLAVQTEAHPIHLAKIVCRKPTHLGFFDASGLGTRVVWLDPSKSSPNLVWRQPWPLDIITELVSSTNLKGTLTNSDI